MIKAQAMWDDILIAYPRDILALKMLSNHSIFVGPKDLLRDSVARVFPHWKQEIPLYGYSNGNCSVDSVKFQHYHEKKLNSIFYPAFRKYRFVISLCHSVQIPHNPRIAHQRLFLARDWSERVKWSNMPQLRLGNLVIFPNYQSLRSMRFESLRLKLIQDEKGFCCRCGRSYLSVCS